MNPRLSRLHVYLRRGASVGSPNGRPSANKRYERMPRFELPLPQTLAMTVSDALLSRKSEREFSKDPLALSQISTLLKASFGARDDGNRPYPSGGALYPIETYAAIREEESSMRSLFHYDPVDHLLFRLCSIPDEERLFADSASWADAAPFSLFFAAAWEKSSRKYDDFAYCLSLLEAGHMAQNALLAATALGIAACPLGGIREDRVAKSLDLDFRAEQPIYAIAFGNRAG